MPIIYRDHIKPPFHAFIADGYARWSTHPSAQACIKLADRLLHYAAPGETGAGYLLIERGTVSRIFTEMRSHKITADQLFLRVCEYVAFFKRHPERAPTQRVEDFSLARGVLHLLPWTNTGRRHGARVLKALGEITREALYQPANAFVERLEADLQETHELTKLAVKFD
jgi:hypothetical protein